MGKSHGTAYGEVTRQQEPEEATGHIVSTDHKHKEKTLFAQLTFSFLSSRTHAHGTVSPKVKLCLSTSINIS